MTENYELFDRPPETDNNFFFSYKKTKENMLIYNNIMDGIAKDKEHLMISSDVAREIFDNSNLIIDSFYSSIKNMSDKWYEKKYNMKIEDLQYASRQNTLNYYSHRHFHSYEGWSIAPYDPNELLNAYPCLRLKEGYKIAAYQFVYTSMSGYAEKFIVPTDRTLPLVPPVYDFMNYIGMLQCIIDIDESFEPKTYRDRLKLFKERIDLLYWKCKISIMKHLKATYRPLPSWVRKDITTYIESDESFHSYFQYSLFNREIYYIGRFGHMPSSGPTSLVLSWNDIPEGSRMFFDKPRDFRPVVWKNDQHINVSYFALNRIEGDIYLVNDEYPEGLQSIKSNEIVIGHTGEELTM